ncbi:MAG TPA: glycosyltransferase family 39 protein [Terracidiphilus sp.]
MTETKIRRTEWLVVLAGCAAASLAATAWSWRHGAMLNYGDAVAHLHIARRVIDSRRPGLSELGSVWLPLPHLLIIPFVAVYAWWANGVAGLIPSAAAYLAGCAGVYRLARRWLEPRESAIALAFFGLNPNLLYLQTTAMTEPLFVCEMVWASLWMVEWRACLDGGDDASRQRANRLLYLIALALSAAVFTRYDGWVMALLAWTAMGMALLKRRRLGSRAFWLAGVIVMASPVVWFLYNAMVFGDWLDFMRGPYSAKAIELRTATAGAGPPHPGWHNLWVSLKFFVKNAEMDAVGERWGTWLLGASVVGTSWAWLIARRKAFAWSLLLWLPVPFYAYAVAYGSVPIFIPPWWPHSWYNTRYGLELLPALALGIAFFTHLLVTGVREFKAQWARYVAAGIFALIAINVVIVIRERPLVYVEGTKNMESRSQYDHEVPLVLGALTRCYPGAPVLMNTSVHPEFVAFSGIPLRQTINESDREFLQAALAAPAKQAAIVVAFEGDEIDRAVRKHPEGLRAVAHFAMKDQPAGMIYVSDTYAGLH